MDHDPCQQRLEGGHNGGVQVSGVLGVVLQCLVLDVLTHPRHCVLAVGMVWGCAWRGHSLIPRPLPPYT